MSPFGYEPESRHTCTPAPANQHKLFVKVRADHNTDGTIRPIAFLSPEGRKVTIDKVLDARQAASLRAGGQGIRYTVRVTCGDTSRDMYLFDDDGVWFIEKE